jgi:hypothetical protein
MNRHKRKFNAMFISIFTIFIGLSVEVMISILRKGEVTYFLDT